MTTKELAMKNYPRCWTDEMVARLVMKGKLTAADYKEIVGEEYTGGVNPVSSANLGGDYAKGAQEA